MSIERERITRTITEDGQPVAVCDGCGKREPAQTDRFWQDGWHPEGWIVVFFQPSADTPSFTRQDLKGVCSWPCLAAYGERQALG